MAKSDLSAVPQPERGPAPPVPPSVTDDTLREELARRDRVRRENDERDQRRADAFAGGKADMQVLVERLNVALDGIRRDLLSWRNVGELHRRYLEAVAEFSEPCERIIAAHPGLVPARHAPTQHRVTRALPLLEMVTD